MTSSGALCDNEDAESSVEVGRSVAHTLSTWGIGARC